MRALVVVCLLCGCAFSPELPDRRITCKAAGDCPAGLGYCVALPTGPSVCCRSPECVASETVGDAQSLDAMVSSERDAGAADAGHGGPGPDAPIADAPAMPDGAAPDAPVIDVAPGGCDPRMDTPCNRCGGVWSCDGKCPKPTRPFGTMIAVDSLNSQAQDDWVWLSHDEKTAYVTSDRTTAGDYDLWIASRPNPTATFSMPRALPNFDGPGTQARAWVSADDLRLYLHVQTKDGDRLATSQRLSASDQFGKPVPLTGFAAGRQDSALYLSPDESRLYFSSDRPENLGGTDLWMLDRAPGPNAGVFTNLRKVPGKVNSADDDRSPVVSGDELTIYFERAPAAGAPRGGDVWMATRPSKDADFAQPVKVDELSLPNVDDHPSFLSDDECTIYVSSDRKGLFDIYMATRGL